MKKIARIVDSQLVEILTFEDGAQDLSAEFALKREELKFENVFATLGTGEDAQIVDGLIFYTASLVLYNQQFFIMNL